MITHNTIKYNDLLTDLKYDMIEGIIDKKNINTPHVFMWLKNKKEYSKVANEKIQLLADILVCDILHKNKTTLYKAYAVTGKGRYSKYRDIKYKYVGALNWLNDNYKANVEMCKGVNLAPRGGKIGETFYFINKEEK